MPNNLPNDMNYGNPDETIYEDLRALNLTHYVMAERCMLVEYASIKEQINTEAQSDTLIYILEGGFRGFHKFSKEHLIEEYKEIEEKFYHLYETNGLPYALYDEDPLEALEQDETGEVAEASPS